MLDPTYARERIKANPVWEIAYIMSEHLNDNAPIGWSSYIKYAKVVAEDKDIRTVLVGSNNST